MSDKPRWTETDDTVWGTEFVYCRSHGRAHSTGWCTVSLYNKVPLMGDTLEEAEEEVQWRKSNGNNWFWTTH